MESTESKYRETIQNAEERLLPFLRTFENVQEEIHLNRVGEAQERLRVAGNAVFPMLTTDLTAFSPPESLQDFHTKLTEAVTKCEAALNAFLSGKGANFAEAFLYGRQMLSRGLYLLYEIRAQLPSLQQYWVTPTAHSSLAALETKTPEVTAPVGFSHKPSTEAHAEYSLYVPENYSPQQTWPLIVCLHGGYGRGDEYIWTWLRPAKSNGYLLLSPKSAGPTWSVLNPPVDIRSIQTMLAEICNAYTVDRKRVYLTGLSDGGTFSYLLGLVCNDLFAGIAPVAGELHPMVDPLLRRGQGKNVPLFIVHGGKDPIFPIDSVRQATGLLEKIGYTVTYKELPEWGHAYPYTINERLVLPWFASLGSVQQSP